MLSYICIHTHVKQPIYRFTHCSIVCSKEIKITELLSKLCILVQWNILQPKYIDKYIKGEGGSALCTIIA